MIEAVVIGAAVSTILPLVSLLQREIIIVTMAVLMIAVVLTRTCHKSTVAVSRQRHHVTCGCVYSAVL